MGLPPAAGVAYPPDMVRRLPLLIATGIGASYAALALLMIFARPFTDWLFEMHTVRNIVLALAILALWSIFLAVLRRRGTETLGDGRSRAIPAVPAIAIVLAPLFVIIGLGIAMAGRSGIGPVGALEITYGIIVPVAAIYPGLAAFVGQRSRIETVIVAVAAAAPAFALAARLVMEPITGRCLGCQPDLWHGFIVRASLPAFTVAATLLAIEVAAAVMRRPGREWVLAGFAVGAVTFGAGGLLSVMGWALIA
jgi:hypothetical protein